MNLNEIQEILKENFDKPREGKKRHIIYWISNLPSNKKASNLGY